MSYNPSAQAGTPQVFSAIDNTTGLPLAGGLLFTYLSGTLTPQATYTDNTLTTQCANPIILDNYGQAIFWLASENYRFNLLNSAGVQQAHYPMDNIQPTSVSNLASNLAASTTTSQGAGLVGYNSALTYPANTVGAGIEAFSSKLAEFVLVTDYGADPTGTLDSTTSIQSAINTGKPVVFPNAGLFKIASSITYTGKVVIFGNKSTILGDGQSFTFTNASNSIITDLTFQPITIPYTILRNPAGWTAIGSQVAQSFQGYIPTSQDTDIWGASSFTATITGTAPTQTMTVSGMTIGPGSTLAVGQPIYYPAVNVAGNVIGTISAFGTGSGGNGTYTITTSSTQSQSGATMSSGLSSTIQAEVYVKPYQRPGIWFRSTSATPNTNVTVSGISGYLTSIVFEGYQYSIVKDCYLGGSTGEGTVNFYNGVNTDTTGTTLGYTLARGQGNQVVNNSLFYGTYCGISFYGNDFFFVSGNKCYYNGESGIKTVQYSGSGYPNTVACTSGIISGNHTFFNFYDGIDAGTVYGTSGYLAGYTVISNNESYSNRATGITTEGSIGITINGNTCEFNGSIGINATGNNSIVSNNILNSNAMFGQYGINNQWGTSTCCDLLVEGNNTISNNNNIFNTYQSNTSVYVHSGSLGGAPTAGLAGLESGNVVTGTYTTSYIDSTIPTCPTSLTYIAPSTACTGALTVSVSWILVQTGNLVTLQLPATQGTATANSAITYGAVIPLQFRPTQTMEFFSAALENNGAYLSTPGGIQVTAQGVISIYQNLSSPNFTSGASAGILATSISWLL
jgi:hypothetical protein